MAGKERRNYVFFAGAAVVALLIMYGTPVASLAVRLIFPLAVAALSRFGLVALHRRVAVRRTGRGRRARRGQIEPYEDDLVRIATTSERPRLLVLADSYFPGWVASVDGNPAAIHRANIGFRAVAVPAGQHMVEFSYRPLSVRIGLAVSIAGLLGILAMFLRGRASVRSTQSVATGSAAW